MDITAATYEWIEMLGKKMLWPHYKQVGDTQFFLWMARVVEAALEIYPTERAAIYRQIIKIAKHWIINPGLDKVSKKDVHVVCNRIPKGWAYHLMDPIGGACESLFDWEAWEDRNGWTSGLAMLHQATLHVAQAGPKRETLADADIRVRAFLNEQLVPLHTLPGDS